MQPSAPSIEKYKKGPTAADVDVVLVHPIDDKSVPTGNEASLSLPQQSQQTLLPNGALSTNTTRNKTVVYSSIVAFVVTLTLILLFTVDGGVQTWSVATSGDDDQSDDALSSNNNNQTNNEANDLNGTPGDECQYEIAYNSYSNFGGDTYECCGEGQTVEYGIFGAYCWNGPSIWGTWTLDLDYVASYPDLFECDVVMESGSFWHEVFTDSVNILTGNVACPADQVCVWRNDLSLDVGVAFATGTGGSYSSKLSVYWASYGAAYYVSTFAKLSPAAENFIADYSDNISWDDYYRGSGSYFNSPPSFNSVIDDSLSRGDLATVGTRCVDDSGSLSSATVSFPSVWGGEETWISGRAYTSSVETYSGEVVSTSVQSSTIQVLLEDENAWLQDHSPANVVSQNNTSKYDVAYAAAEYINQGIAEHTSLASFSRVSVLLLSLAAPPDVLYHTYQAAADEVRHAQVCFTLAHQFGGSSVPDVFPFPEHVIEAKVSAAELAVMTLEEGVIGETLAVVRLLVRAKLEGLDEALATKLLSIALDEARHAALAWRTVSFLLYEHEDRAHVAAAVELYLNNAADQEVRQPNQSDMSSSLAHFGLLSPSVMTYINEHVTHAVVRPWVTLMLTCSSWAEFQQKIELWQPSDVDVEDNIFRLVGKRDGMNYVAKAISQWNVNLP